MPTPSLLLVHGAATGAWVWDLWRSELGARGRQVNVIDLRGHGRSLPIDLATVTMDDYVADLESVTVQIERAQGVHPIVGGWSMGGTVAMMYAARHPETTGLLIFDPMPPAEVRKGEIDTVRRFAGNVLTPATFGIYAGDRERSRKVLFDLDDEELDAYLRNSASAEEGGVAFRQTLRGISVPADSIACPTLIVSPEGDTASWEMNRRLAEHLRAEVLSVPQSGHWGIVWHAPAVAVAAEGVEAWLGRFADSEIG